MEDLIQRIKGLRGLPSLSDSLSRLTRALRNPEVSSSEIEEVILRDASLAIAMLRMANSSLYGGRSSTDSVRDAITRLGRDRLMKIAVAQQTGALLESGNTGYGQEAGDARRAALAGALAAEWLGERVSNVESDAAFTAALMRDCGKLAMVPLLGADLLAAAFARPGEVDDWLEFERSVLHVDHAEVGAALAGHWGLPDTLVDAVRHHHGPPDEDCAPLVDVVYVADAIAAHIGAGAGDDGLAYPFQANSLRRLGLTHTDLMEGIAYLTARYVAYEEELSAEAGAEAA